MKSAEQWLDEYALTHRHPTNKLIHYICVPSILWSVLALLWVVPRPSFLGSLNWAVVFCAMALGFYLRLGVRHFVGMFLVLILALGTIMGFESLDLPIAMIAMVVFVVAWIGQFYGHVLEGKKPSFFEESLFLLIGPLWIQNRIFRQIR
jgi:uncharacterized membrane protein YGL010W